MSEERPCYMYEKIFAELCAARASTILRTIYAMIRTTSCTSEK